jgi:hypothetical protein
MSNEPSLLRCPQCGTPLGENAPAGLCPNCLMALNLKTETVFTGDLPAAQAPLPPEHIAPHFPQLEILECLGRGGMGVVYKARQKTLNRLVALKLLAPERVGDPKFAERFAAEAHALAALSHPNIVTIHDFGQAGGFYFLLMEFVEGVNLRQLLKARKFTPEEALAIVPPLCDALQFAHERGIVHRDIKPENILLDKAGRVKIADFGIAKMLGANDGGVPSQTVSPESMTQGAIGTPAYSAPEQKTASQRVDSRADIYSLGVVFYEMLTGELPGKPIELPSRKVRIDVRLDEVVLRALEQTPELRYQHASQLKTQVETIATSDVQKPDSTGRASAPTAKKSRLSAERFTSTPMFAALTAVAFLLLVGSGDAWVMLIGSAGLLAIGLMWFARRDWRVALLVTLAGVGVAGGLVLLFFQGWLPGIDRAANRERASEADSWTNAIRLNQIFGLGADGVSSYGGPDFKYEVVYDEKSVALTVSYRRQEGTHYRVQLEERSGRKRALGEDGLASITHVEDGHTVVREKKMLSRAEFEKVAALILQQRFEDKGAAPATFGPVTAFGPAITRVIQSIETGTNLFLDLDTGNLLTPPKEIRALFNEPYLTRVSWERASDARARRMRDWIRSSGANLMVSDAGHGTVRLEMHDGVVMPSPLIVSNGVRTRLEFDSAEPGYLANRINPMLLSMEQRSAPPIYLLQPGFDEELNTRLDTFCFRTRSGSVGILQVLNAEDNPVGVKVRYRLLHTATSLSHPVQPPASKLTWSPKLAPGEKPNFDKLRQETANLIGRGNYEEALQRCLWYHKEAVRIDPAQGPMRLTFALEQWGQLARLYPKARQAMVEIRNRGLGEFANGRGYLDLLREIQALNEQLGEPESTAALFDSIRREDPGLARQCYPYVERTLFERGEYAACAEFIRDFQARFTHIRNVRERMQALADNPQLNAIDQPAQRAQTRRAFIEDTRMLIEILVGVERLEEAEKIRARALEILNVAELQSAVSDAEEKIRARHAALAPIPPRAAELVAAWNAHAHAFAQKHDMSDTNVQAALQRELAPLDAEIEALLVGTIAEPLVRRQRLLMAELRQASEAEDYTRIQEAGERLKATSDEIGKMMKAAGNSLKTNRW